MTTLDELLVLDAIAMGDSQGFGTNHAAANAHLTVCDQSM
jgi:hypothetical protein